MRSGRDSEASPRPAAPATPEARGGMDDLFDRTGFKITEGKPLCPAGHPPPATTSGSAPRNPCRHRRPRRRGFRLHRLPGEGQHVRDRELYPETPVLPYATLEALAKKVAAEVAASPATVDNVTCTSFPRHRGPVRPEALPLILRRARATRLG